MMRAEDAIHAPGGGYRMVTFDGGTALISKPIFDHPFHGWEITALTFSPRLRVAGE